MAYPRPSSPTVRVNRLHRLTRLWLLSLPLAVLASLAATHAHAQGADAAPPTAAGSSFNPTADISRAVGRDSTDNAIQSNWNSITHPTPVAKPADDKADQAPKRRRSPINIGSSTN